MTHCPPHHQSSAQDTASLPVLALRGAFGGALMGLANLVPGISGGTMLVAAGIYQRFIDAIAKLSTFRFEKQAIVILGSTGFTAVLAIGLLAGTVRDLVLDHRWVMYSLFIGLTLGGVPVVWRMIKQVTPGVWGGATVGFIGMAVLAVLQQSAGGAGGDERSNVFVMAMAGVAGASAMILPGVSGGYLLLVIGAYVPILTAVDQLKDAIHARDVAAAMGPMLEVVLPVGVGVVVGVVVVSNLLRALLDRWENPTLGSLLGLLVGAVVGLWPFQQAVQPLPGQMIKGRVMTPELIAGLKAKDLPTEWFSPTSGQVIASIALIIGGFLVTCLVAKLGNTKRAD